MFDQGRAVETAAQGHHLNAQLHAQSTQPFLRMNSELTFAKSP
jgi:hypothetical protein